MADITLRGALSRDDSGAPVGFNYAYISAATGATLVKASPGVLNLITFNKPVATSVVTLYDCATTATLTGTIGQITIPSSPMQTTYTYRVDVNNGLVVNVGTAGSDITISYI